MASAERAQEGMLSVASLITALIGAAGSLTLMSIAGRHQRSLVLILLFAAWVVSPFVALVFGRAISRYWGVSDTGLFSLTLAITVGCLSIYAGVVLGYVKAKAGFVFLIVPLVSWMAIAVTFVAASLTSSEPARRRKAS